MKPNKSDTEHISDGSNRNKPKGLDSEDSSDTLESTKATTVTKRRGRPPKKKNPVGRPKGEGAIMKEYRQRMLNSPKSRKVLDAILNAALDDDHKGQQAAWKIIADRILPVSSFELDTKNSKPSVNITITGIGEQSRVNIDDGPIEDADFEEVEDEE